MLIQCGCLNHWGIFFLKAMVLSRLSPKMHAHTLLRRCFSFPTRRWPQGDRDHGGLSPGERAHGTLLDYIYYVYILTNKKQDYLKILIFRLSMANYAYNIYIYIYLYNNIQMLHENNAKQNRIPHETSICFNKLSLDFSRVQRSKTYQDYPSQQSMVHL